MSKVIEDAAQDFAAINDDKAANSAHSYSKYDIADAYQQGADFGYSLAENRIKKEYEENLRWIPVEEELPEKMQTEPSVSKVVQVKSKNFSEPFCAFYNHLYGIWLPYPFGSNSQIVGITEWRYFL